MWCKNGMKEPLPCKYERGAHGASNSAHCLRQVYLLVSRRIGLLLLTNCSWLLQLLVLMTPSS
jgi:hypothetical protein